MEKAQKDRKTKNRKKYKKRATNKQRKANKIFVGGLPSHTTHEMLEVYFKKFGWIKRCQPKMWKNNPNRCKGFAIIILGDKKTYSKILEEKSHIFEGREIECKEVLSRNKLDNYSKNLNERKVYVRGISLKTESENLKIAFSQFGEVEMAYVVRDRRSGQSLGFGYITFKNKEGRNKALKRRNFLVEGKLVVCYQYDGKKYEQKNANEGSVRKRKGKQTWKENKAIKEESDEVSESWDGSHLIDNISIQEGRFFLFCCLLFF